MRVVSAGVGGTAGKTSLYRNPYWRHTHGEVSEGRQCGQKVKEERSRSIADRSDVIVLFSRPCE